MARRQAVQLQADIQTDEEFDKFIETPGLLVIDVYTEWCGPCTGMVNALKKLKLEQAGDALSLAIARCDTISYLQRFHKKSEPTWLFITQGKSVNIMFGADCPKLMFLIMDELRSLGKPHKTFNITEMLPVEVERDNAKNAVKRAKLQKELEEQDRKKSDYLHYVTDTIRENLPDVGITIFGPHVQRETFRHLIDCGPERFGITCKDRRCQVITKEQFDIVNYFCKNPMSPEVLEVIEGKEMFIGFWKVPDGSAVAEILQKYADDVGKPRRLPPDEYRSEEQVIPPLATMDKVKMEFELPVGQECPIDEEQETLKQQQKHTKPTDAPTESPRESQQREATAQDGSNEEEEDDENEENDGEGPVEETKTEMPTVPDFGMDIDLDDDAEYLSTGEEEEEIVDDTPKKNICTRTVTVPAIWVPKDWRTHAAAIYVFFHTQTTGFLPPDPVPEPPHVIMAFDTYKKRDLVDFAERYKEDIPLYGFFTSDQADEAKHITSSKANYVRGTQAATDKLIFKVNKRTSHTMLSLATYGPTYVSPNTTVGAEEAKIFFPDNYVSADQEQLQSLETKITPEKGKGKKGRKTDGSHEKLQAETLPLAATTDEEHASMELEVKKSLEAVAVEPAEAAASAEAHTEEHVGAQAEKADEAGEAGGDVGEAGGDVGEGAEIPAHEELQQEQPAPVTEEPAAAEAVTETTPETAVAETADGTA